jgi:hypothetical protein
LSSRHDLIDATAGEWYKVPGSKEKGEAVSALRPTGGIVAALLLLTASASISAQRGGASAQGGKPGSAVESRSAALASELTKLLSSQNLDSIASPDAETYVGALLAPGQLFVVRAKMSKDRMSYLLINKMYKDAYLDLNSASEAASRVLVMDLGADGLQFKNAKDQPFDMVSVAGRQMSFDGKWGGKENPSKDEYAKTFESSDEQYTQMLQVLISAMKKSS